MKTETVESLRPDIDEFEASVQRLTEDVADLNQEVEEFDAAVIKVMEIRSVRTGETATRVSTGEMATSLRVKNQWNLQADAQDSVDFTEQWDE